MTRHGFARSAYDSCVYLKKLSEGSYVYLLLYVDDMLIAAKEMSRINLLKKQLNDEFEMKKLGAAQSILGMDIIRDRKAGKVKLSQKAYIEKVLQRFNMNESKQITIPFTAHFT